MEMELEESANGMGMGAFLELVLGREAKESKC